MLKKMTFALIIQFTCQAIAAQSVPCPQPNVASNVFDVPGSDGSLVAIEKRNDADYPINITQYMRNKNGQCDYRVIERYSVEGGWPKIESLFFYNIAGVENVLTIVSWVQNHRAMGTYGVLYQVYAYRRSASGWLVENEVVAKDDNMTGVDGYLDGKPSLFKYKTASAVKKYLQLH